MPRISYQLYCSRNFPPTGDTLKMLGTAGYKEVEGYRGLLDDVEGLKAALDASGLRMTSCHVGPDMIASDPQGVLALVKSFGIEKVFGPYMTPDERPTDSDGWRAFAKGFAESCKPLQDAGVICGWHNHDFEFVPTPQGDLPNDLIADASDDMRLELDLGWVKRAGLDPVATINKYGSKITTAHIKDIAPAGECADEDGWADVGHGVMDWPAIHAALQSHGVDHYIVEHDNPSDDKRFATRSFAAINAL